MELAKYAALAVVEEGRSLRAVASSTGRSKSWVEQQVSRYREGGEDALVVRKRGPRHAPNRIPPDQEDEIVAWRKRLDDEGLDAGARTIRYHLLETGSLAPSLATIHRVLVRRGFVVAEPKKRPRTSWIRFESAQPNECWQSDMTHWHLADGTNAEIVNFIDDHSRAALSSTVLSVATAPGVQRCFWATVKEFGLPTSVLSDNGLIYTAAYRGSYTALERELNALGIAFKHGKPYHPQTQGKVERFHKTLKKWLEKQPEVDTLTELQRQVNRFVALYNEWRSHQAHGRPPMRVYRERVKATLELEGQPLGVLSRVRRDKVHANGTVTLRYNGHLHHISVGRRHHGMRVLMLITGLDVHVVGEDRSVLRRFTLDPSVNYQRLEIGSVGSTVH
jgi:transposase InsO family protein